MCKKNVTGVCVHDTDPENSALLVVIASKSVGKLRRIYESIKSLYTNSGILNVPVSLRSVTFKLGRGHRVLETTILVPFCEREIKRPEIVGYK